MRWLWGALLYCIYIPIYYLYAKIWGPKKCLLWDYPRSWWKAIDVKRKRKKYSAAAWPEFGTFLVIVHYCWFRRTCTDHCNQLIFLFSSLLPSSVPVRDKYFAKKAKLSRRSIFRGAELCITVFYLIWYIKMIIFIFELHSLRSSINNHQSYDK